MSLDLQLNLKRESGFTLDLNLQLPTDRVTALYGPSGSGKSSILRVVAGLDHVPGATVSMDGDTWQTGGHFTPVHDREVGYVFQHLNLFPHLTAQGNLDFARERAHQAEGPDPNEVLDILEISSLVQRYPDQLSGGEQQRVAIARALLSNPRLLLMDEPLGSIDADARVRILPHLQRLNRHLKIPVIYVSHSLDEVLYLTDQVITMNQGTVTSDLSTMEFAVSEHATRQADASALISCTVVEQEDEFGLTRLSFEDQSLFISADHYNAGDRIQVRVPARDVSLSQQHHADSSILNVINCEVESILDQDDGPTVIVRLTAGNQKLLARITKRSRSDLNLNPGDELFAQIKGVALMTDYERH